MKLQGFVCPPGTTVNLKKKMGDRKRNCLKIGGVAHQKMLGLMDSQGRRKQCPAHKIRVNKRCVFKYGQRGKSYLRKQTVYKSPHLPYVGKRCPKGHRYHAGLNDCVQKCPTGHRMAIDVFGRPVCGHRKSMQFMKYI